MSNGMNTKRDTNEVLIIRNQGMAHPNRNIESLIITNAYSPKLSHNSTAVMNEINVVRNDWYMDMHIHN